MLKDYVEDYKRKKSDSEENNRIVSLYMENERFMPVKWRSLLIGNVIKVKT